MFFILIRILNSTEQHLGNKQSYQSSSNLFSMNTKLQVLFLSLSILWYLMADIEAQQSNARPKGGEVFSGIADAEILGKVANSNDALILIPNLVNLTAAQMENRLEPSGRRESRKFKLFDIWNKPKTSPLFLINGTVCRFVNSNPICTNLSTTGLFRKFSK